LLADEAGNGPASHPAATIDVDIIPTSSQKIQIFVLARKQKVSAATHVCVFAQLPQ
jgi:hypothetical protein